MKRPPVLLASVLLLAACAHSQGSASGDRSRSCSSARVAVTGTLDADAAAALRCFSAAARACTPAHISYFEHAVDTGVDVKVTILPGTPCEARYVYQTWGGAGPPDEAPKGPENTLICSMALNAEHVDFTCPTVTDEIPTG